tara:strand:+ start:539 stop:1855 length:1317 start_codon:yes stop_codon:yes gene_type:complete
MANLVQLSNELEYVPKEQLAQMSQDPNSRFPSYLVLSEIQRRTANERAYAAAQPQPTTTVAEEVVGDFMQPKGLQAGMPSESAPTDVFSSEPMGIPASAPMQQPMQLPMAMASGGLTGYAVGGPAMSPLDRSFISSLGDSVYDRYTDEDGLDYSQALLDASMLIPGSLLLRGAGLGLKGLYQSGRLGDAARFLGRQGKRMFTKPNPDVIRGPGFIAGRSANKLKGEVAEAAKDTVFSPTKAGLSSALIGIPAANIVDYMSEDNQIAQEEKRELTQAEKDYQKLMQDIQLANLKASQEDTKKGLGGAFSSTDLIQLGGTIMGAKNISELGQGIAAVAGASADRKTAAERAGLEARYLQAQTGKLEADIDAMPLQDALASLKQIDIFLKNINEGAGDATEQQIQELLQQRQFLQQKILKAQGYSSQAMSGTNQSLIASYT